MNKNGRLMSGFLIGYSSIAAFLFFSLSLIVPTGYSYGAGVLFFMGLMHAFKFSVWRLFDRKDWLVFSVLAFFCVIWFLEIIIHSEGLRELDKPSRFLAAALILPFLLRYPPRPDFIWSGVCLGAFLAGFWATWQKFFEGVGRATGYTNTIQFGNISLLLGVLCLAGFGWAYGRPYARFWMFFLGLGFFMGFTGSLLSGSRGGWIALPLCFLVLFRGYRDFLPRKYLLTFFAFLFSFLLLAYLIPHSGVQLRINQAVGEVSEFFLNDVVETSVGARLEMWQGAFFILKENIAFGVGSSGYVVKKSEMVGRGELSGFVLRFDHPHNEYLDVSVKRGVLGLISLLLLYLIPMRLFYGFFSAPLEVRSIAIAGVILCVSYVDFGLTQSFMAHNSGVMIYSFSLVLFWSLVRSYNENGRIHV